MTLFQRLWAGPVALIVATSALSACGGGSLPTTPSMQGFSQPASAGADRSFRSSITIVRGEPNVNCPSRFYDCTTVSQKNGAVIIWCYGTRRQPCRDTDAYTWSGIVCTAAGATCKKPIKQLTAKWSGPFKCRPKDRCKGTYVLDTLKPGPGLKVTKKYIYKQDVRMCAGRVCTNDYSGINVDK